MGPRARAPGAVFGGAGARPRAKTLLNTRMARAYKRWLGYMAELEEERARQRAVAEAERLRRKEAFLLKQLFRNL